MKIQYSEYSNSCCFCAYDENTSLLAGEVIIDMSGDEYPRYKEYCNGIKLAKIIRVETSPLYVGKGVASKLIKTAIEKLNNYNLLLLCCPCGRFERGENTDTLKTVSDLQMFYSKFGFVKTNELLPTMIKVMK